MRKIILGLATSLDNFIEGPNGEYDWCFTDQDYGMTQFMNSIDSIFYGRKSYELVLRENSLHDFLTKKSYVFSNSEKAFTDATMIGGDIGQQVNDIKKSPGKNIWLFGGSSLTMSLMKLKLVDHIWLSVHPIILGKGKPLFEGLDSRVVLELKDNKTYNTGLVSLYYNVKTK